MAEYAAAIKSGVTAPAVAKPAAAVEKEETAAATEEETQAAATTEEAKNDGKTTTESATEEAPDALVEEAHPAKKGIQKRFSEMTAKQKEIQAQADANKAEADKAIGEAAALKAEIEQMRQQSAQAAAAAVPVVPAAADDPKPLRDLFDDPDEYAAAMTAHTARDEIRKASAIAQENANKLQQEVQERQKQAEQVRVQEQITALHKTFNERVEVAKAEYPDYDTKVTNNTELMMQNAHFFAIQRSELAPHILHHIASDPALAKELFSMNNVDAAMKIGEISAEIRIARKPKPSKAAEPVKPVASRSSPQTKTPNEETMDEYAARVQSELKTKAAGRPRTQTLKR